MRETSRGLLHVYMNLFSLKFQDGKLFNPVIMNKHAFLTGFGTSLGAQQMLMHIMLMKR